MATCVLRAYGRDFDLDAFLAVSEWEPLRAYRSGEEHRIWKKSEDSGMNILVCEDMPDGDSLTLASERAVQFIAKWSDEFARLRDSPGLESMCLDFAVFCADEAEIETWAIPVELLRQAGTYGADIVITRYAVNPETAVDE
jgi:hypothetical protein